VKKKKKKDRRRSRLADLEHEGREEAECGRRRRAEAARAPVLIVDDDADHRETVRALLEAAGHVVVVFPNGAEVLGYLASASELPALIVTDLEMPVLSGWELMAFLERTAFIDVPVVVLSACSRRAPRIERAHFLPKPVAPDRLLSCVEALTSPRNSHAQTDAPGASLQAHAATCGLIFAG